jgi:hypothetical protein
MPLGWLNPNNPEYIFGANGIFGSHQAAGGPVRAGVPYIVGERRAEVFVPGENGRILPSVPDAMRGWAGGDTVLHTHIDLDGREVADVVSRFQADDYRR